MAPRRSSFRAMLATMGAALLCAAVAASCNWLRPQARAALLSQGEAAAVLERVLRTHDEAAAHHAGAVLEAVVDSVDL